MNPRKNAAVKVISLGLIEYNQAWAYQTELFQSILAIKKENRDRADDDQVVTNNYLLVCEHPAVITMGKSGNPENLLASPEQLASQGVAYVKTNRGGDITFHGPEQLVIYPILDLENFFTDISRYMRTLEQAVIETLKPYQIAGTRVPGLTGVWISEGNSTRKICAMGVKTSRWVTMHGLALNVNVDLGYFDLIVPCGINDREVTSMKEEHGKHIAMTEVAASLTQNLISAFSMEVTKEQHWFSPPR